MEKKPKARKSRYSFSKLPETEMIGAGRHMVQSVVDQYRGRDRAKYPGTRSPDS